MYSDLSALTTSVRCWFNSNYPGHFF